MRNLLLVCLAVLAVGASGCSGIPGSGVMKKKAYTVSPFKSVSISGTGSVNVTQGPEPSVTIQTDDNLHQYLKVEVVDGRLSISQTENLNPSDGIDIQVVTNELTEFSLSGAAEAKLNAITGPSLKVSLSGAGSIEGAGEVDDVTINLSGVGSADFKDLVAKKVKVRNSGVGSAEVHASEDFDGDVSGVGSIECHGNPENVKKHVSGVGSIDVNKE